MRTPRSSNRGAVRISVNEGCDAAIPVRRTFLHHLLAQGAALPTALALAHSGNAMAQSPAARSPLPRSANAGVTPRAQVQHHFESPHLELIRLLREACSVEHALMLQYLYAAFSVKPAYAALAGAGAPSTHDLLGVAVQEMQHLGAVNRLLVTLGAAPNLLSVDFPFEPEIYPFEFNLEPLNRSSLAKYVYTEAPVGFFDARAAADHSLVAAVIRAIGPKRRPNHVGSLYDAIIDLVKEVSRDPGMPDMQPWLKRLDTIKAEGEVDHFNFFKNLFLAQHKGFGGRHDAWELAPSDAAYPAYTLPRNPTAYPGHANEIHNPVARALAWLGNLHYWAALLLLDQSYRTDDAIARGLALTQMMGPMMSLGRHLPKLGVGMPFDAAHFGASPALNADAGRRLIVALLHEADTLTGRIEASLPSDYQRDVARQTLAVLQSGGRREVQQVGASTH